AVLDADYSFDVKGTAANEWFFGPTFAIMLTDLNGKILARGDAAAEGNWSSKAIVPFSGTLVFARQPAGSKGFVVLVRNDPAPISDRDATVSVPIVFK
ncbi:MAG: hypothetical protein QOG91_653, partial [Candidatus Parcubacteria bacterium]|nr:hypothetical protein [Candidatus Parcubacteria bacterium]